MQSNRNSFKRRKFKIYGEHNHPVHRAKLAVNNVVLSNVQNCSRHGEIPQRNIVANILEDVSNLGTYATGLLSNTKTLKQKIAREKKRATNEPPLPVNLLTDLEEIEDQFNLLIPKLLLVNQFG